MSVELELLLRQMVNNLHLTLLHRALEKWSTKEPFEIRDELGIASYSETSTEPEKLYRKVKRHILREAFQEDEVVDALLDAQGWAGFSLNTELLDTGERIILAARNGAVATLWLMALPRTVASPALDPREVGSAALAALMELILESAESRSRLRNLMADILKSKGVTPETFDIEALVEGHRISESLRRSRTQLVIALVILRATELPFDLDRVFSLDTQGLLREIQAYIVAMHTLTTLRREITGIGGQSRFEWPSVGDISACTRLFSHLRVLQRASADMTTCTLFQKTMQGKRQPWTEREFISFLVAELTDHYSAAVKSNRGRPVNRELAVFVDHLKNDNYDIVSDLLESTTRSETLFEELKFYRRTARTGERPDVRPERKFRITLADIRSNIQGEKIEKLNLSELVELVTQAFDAIAEMVTGTLETLGSDAEKFTETLSFETAQRILELLGLEEAIGDLPWISRFISEESERMSGDAEGRTGTDVEDRILRISSAFAGSVVYVFVQARG
jgi:hypothetical protein